MKESNTEKANNNEKTSTERVAEFIASTACDNVPDSAILVAKYALLDWLGVSIAGSKEIGAQILSNYIRKSEARNEASVIGQGFKTTAELAAWANGNIGHSIDFDDTSPDVVHYNMHPSTCVLPAVLALAEKRHLSGCQMLTAYVVGMEVMYRIGAVIGDVTSKNGWHPTPVIGSMGTAAACANILDLSQIQVSYALGIAASLAGGLRNNFGSMTKPFHAGNAARNGVIAAELAAEGFTSNPNILDGDYSFCYIFGGKLVNGLLGQENDLGKEWRLVSQGIGFKYYPSCRSTHSSIDATRYLRNKFNIGIDQLAGIICTIDPHHLNMAKFNKPETGYQGKFSIPYCIATALLKGNILLSDFTDDKVRDTTTQAIMSKVKFVPAASRKDGVVDLAAKITIRLKNGEEHSHRISLPTGEPENPMSEEEMLDKFKSCSSVIFNESDVGRIIDIVRSLERIEDLTPLFDIMVKSSETY